MTGHYAALGGHRRMTTEELRDLWRLRSRRLHPDKGGDAAAFAEASVAWGILRDRAERQRYDRTLALTRNKCRRCHGEGRLLARQVGFARRLWERCGDCAGEGFVPRPGRPRGRPK